MDSNAREDLDALVKSPGWLRFLAHVEQEWGTRTKGGGAHFTSAARHAADQTDDQRALSHLRQICVAQKEIHTVIQWVYDALKGEEKAERELATAGPTDYSRRGGL